MSERPLFRVQNLAVLRGAEAVVNGLSLTLSPGELVAMAGASGAGKSTCLRALCFLEGPATGEVFLGGDAFLFRRTGRGRQWAPTARERARYFAQVTMVAQDGGLWPHLSVERNVVGPQLWSLGRRPKEALARAHEELAALGVLAQREHEVMALSGGQAQRVALARALCLDRPVVFLDEPTAGLDEAAAAWLGARLRAYAGGGRAVLLVSHDPAWCRRFATRRMIFADGRLGQLVDVRRVETGLSWVG